MGIGNAHDLGVLGRLRLLITPHGDRKRRVSIGKALGKCLITLMGIGNLSKWRSERRGPSSSLPLMGIGNAESKQSRKRAFRDSLPLMGIGNRVAAHGKGRVAVLITPHGDRKLSTRSSRKLCATTSLPLMGIGNTIAGFVQRPACISLPLMGIGNDVVIVRRAEHLHLITPHGDRKPPWFCGRCY